MQNHLFFGKIKNIIKEQINLWSVKKIKKNLIIEINDLNFKLKKIHSIQ